MINNIKTIIGIVLLIITIAMAVIVKITYDNLKKSEAEKTRIENNLYNSQFKIDSLKTKNGELLISVNDLKVNQDELKKLNAPLYNELKNMGVKINNLESVISAKIEYNFKQKDNGKDTTKIDKKSPNVFVTNYDDNWLKFSQRITLINNKSNIKADSTIINIKDSLTIAKETQYKGWWFWRKAINIKLKIKSENPYSNINRIETYDLTK